MNKKFYYSFLILIIFIVLGFLLIHKTSQAPAPSNTAVSVTPDTVPTTITPATTVQTSQNIKSVEIGGQNVIVDLALTQAEQTQGLSGRTSLASNTGMLFVFPQPGKFLFWMKDMNFALDMIWITSDMHVDYIAKDATPASYPATFGPGANDQDALYVLEVPSGFADANNLKVGDAVEFSY